MHTIIVGGEKIGVSIGEWLVSEGHEIAVIDFDKNACTNIDEALGAVSVFGVCMNVNVLQKAGAERADVVIATTTRDDVNLAACQIAKQMYHVPRTVSIINDQDNADLFDSLGIDLIVNLTNLLTSHIQEGITSNVVAQLMPISGTGNEKSLLMLRVPREYSNSTLPLKSLPLPEGAAVTLVIRRDGPVSFPDETIMLQAGDEVLLIGSDVVERELRDFVARGPTII